MNRSTTTPLGPSAGTGVRVLAVALTVLAMATSGVVSGGSLAGQAVEAAPRFPPAASDFAVGQLVRLTAPGIVIDEGTVQQILGDTLFVELDGVQWSVQASLLEQASVRESRVVRNAVVGLFPGALFGVIGAFMTNKLCANDCTSANYGKGVLIGGGIGAGLGAIVGAGTTHWRQLFP